MSTRLFKVGFATTDTPGDVQWMDSNCSASDYNSFQQGGSAFQVTSGKTLYIGTVMGTAASAASQPAFFYSTASVSNNSSAPSGNTPIGSGNSGGIFIPTGSMLVVSVLMTIPSTKYFNLFANSNAINMSAIGLMF